MLVLLSENRALARRKLETLASKVVCVHAILCSHVCVSAMLSFRPSLTFLNALDSDYLCFDKGIEMVTKDSYEYDGFQQTIVTTVEKFL